MPLKPVHVPDKMEIRLSQTEDDLCKLLDESVAWMAETKHLPTSCRIAGGWVRDKVCNVKILVVLPTYHSSCLGQTRTTSTLHWRMLWVLTSPRSLLSLLAR
jgi:hypothetical protein